MVIYAISYIFEDYYKPKKKIMIYETGQKVQGITDDCIYEILQKVEGSRTKYLVKDVTPDGEKIWHQRPEGGAYVTQFINGFIGEESIVHIKEIKKI